MTISLVINGKTDISAFVKSASLSGDVTRIARKLDVVLHATADGRKRAYTINEGDKLTFRYDGKMLMLGVVFNVKIDSSGEYNVTCYDTNIYLVKSTDSKKYLRKKASDIIRTLAKDFGVSLGDIADTGYVIPYYRANNKALSELILTTLKLTRLQTSKRYFVGNQAGKLTVYPVTSTQRYVFKSGQNLISASYSRSIEDTKTQAKVVGGEKGKETVVVARDDKMRAKYGVLQAYEQMDEKATPSQVKQRAKAILSESAVVEESLSIEALGVPEVDVGTAVYVRNQMTSTNGAYYVEEFTHTFAKSLHTMSLKLVRTFELPDITIDADELKPEQVKAKKKTTKKEEAKKK